MESQRLVQSFVLMTVFGHNALIQQSNTMLKCGVLMLYINTMQYDKQLMQCTNELH